MKHVATTIARTPTCRIDRCSCGAIHISVGGTTIRVKDGVARELRNALAVAMAKVDEQNNAAPAPRAFQLIHSLGDDDPDPELH